MVVVESEWRLGWRVVLGAAIGLGCGPLVYQYIASIFMSEIAAEFGWSRSEAASMMGMMAAGAVSGPVVGYLADRVGAKPILLTASALMVPIYLFFAFAPPSLGAYRLAVGMLYFFGVGCSALTYSRVVNAWFVQKRGAALALSSSGVAAAALLLPIALHLIIADYGWRAGYMFLAGLAAVGGFAAATLLFAREAPNGPKAGETASAGERPAVNWGGIFRLPAFWLILFAMFMVHIAASAILTHFIPIMADHDLSAGHATALLSFYGVCVLAGRLATGFLLDLGRPHVTAFIITLSAAIAVTILLLTPAPSMATMAIIVLLLGLQMGAELDLLPFFLARHIGLRVYGSVYGIMTASILISSGAGSQLFGLLYDLRGDYSIALTFAAAAFGLGACAFLALGSVARNDERHLARDAHATNV